MCPVCKSELVFDLVTKIAGKDITNFIEKCTACEYRISVIQFNEDIEEDLF